MATVTAMVAPPVVVVAIVVPPVLVLHLVLVLLRTRTNRLRTKDGRPKQQNASCEK